jgi:hypothetical protein
MCAVIISFGVSFEMLQGLQGPLSSLNAAAHVCYRLARCRLVANNYAFIHDPSSIASWRSQVLDELSMLRQEYTALLYGGRIPQVVRGDRSYHLRSGGGSLVHASFVRCRSMVTL